MSNSKAAAIADVCNLLSAGQSERARELLRTACVSNAVEIPSSSAKNVSNLPGGRTERKYSDEQKIRLFLRDHFIDRYSSERLVFPGVLRLLSDLFPEEFPYHPNWKYGACHGWYWELYPTVDHVESTGADSDQNWVTTSMMRNLKKSNVSLSKHGWSVLPVAIGAEWDGLLTWYINFLDVRPELQKVTTLKEWYTAAKKVRAGAAQLGRSS